MKHRKQLDNSSMSIQMKFLKEESDLIDTDVNGNDNKFVSPESGVSQCHGHMTLPERHLSEHLVTCEKNMRGKRQDARKLPPLRISKARLSSFPDTHEDSNSTSSLRQHLKPRKPAKDHGNFKTDEQCKNIFSDFSMSHFSEMTRARTDISVKVDANKKKELKDKQSQKHPKLQVSLTLVEKEPEKDFMSTKEADITHSARHQSSNGYANLQTLSILVSEFDTDNDNSELKSKSQNVKLSNNDNYLYNNSKEDSQHNGDHIPQLSPIVIHKTDNMYMLPSPLYSLQPPVLTPFSEDLTTKMEDYNDFSILKPETDTPELSPVDALQQKSSNSLTSLHISAIKKTLKRTTCHALESAGAERKRCHLKDNNLLLQRPHEMLSNGSEQKVSEEFKYQKLHHNMNYLDNADRKTIDKDNLTEILALSTKDKYNNYNHGKYSNSKNITRNKNHLTDGSTVINAIEGIVNSKLNKRKSQSIQSIETDVKRFSGNDENNHLEAMTNSLANVDQIDKTLMHCTVKISRQCELILSQQLQKLASNISSISADHKVTEPGVVDSQCVPSVPSSTVIEDHKSSTNLQQACYDRCVNHLENEQLSSLKPVSPIQAATHKRSSDKSLRPTNSLSSNGELQPCLMEQESEPHYSVVPTPEQSIPTSSNCRDVLGLKTDIIGSVLCENTQDNILLEHGNPLTEAHSMDTGKKTSHSYVGEDSEQPYDAKLKPLPIVNIQMCTAFEKDLFSDMHIKDERRVSSSTPGENTVNSLQHETSSDVLTQDGTERQSLEPDPGGSLTSKDSLLSKNQAGASTFQSKYVEAISGDLKPELQTLSTTDIIVVSPVATTVNALPIDADRISPHDATVSSNVFTFTASPPLTTTVRIVPSHSTVVRASSAGARDFRVFAANETTFGMLPADVTTVRASSTNTLVSQTNSNASHLLSQKLNMPLAGSISKTCTKLDPDAVKNMSLHIIHHSGKRNICEPKKTTQQADQLSSSIYSALPTPLAVTSRVASVNRISENVHKDKRNSVISMTNSYVAKAQHSQLFVPSSKCMETRMYSPHEEFVSARHNYNNLQSLWQPVRVDYSKCVETAKNVDSEQILTTLKPDHVLAKRPNVSHYHRENVRMPYIAPPLPLNYQSNGTSNSQIIAYTQQPLRFENQQVPFDLTSDSEPRGSLDIFNIFSHMPASEMAKHNRNYSPTSEPIKRTDYSQKLQVMEQEAGRVGKLLSDSSTQDGVSQARIHRAEDSSLTLAHEFPNEPLDLSFPKDKQHTPLCTEKVLVELNSEHLQPDVKIVFPSTGTVCQPDICTSEYITVSPDLPTYVPPKNTSCEVVSNVQTVCQNKDLFALSKFLTPPHNSLVNSLPTTVSSTRLQSLCHRSPLLETALLHNIVPKDRDPHPFNSVIPECLITRPSSCGQRESRLFTNKQTDYNVSQVHFSQAASIEPSCAASTINSTVPFLDNHTSLVTSATVISPPVSQSSKSVLPLLSCPEVTKHMASNNNMQSGQHTTAVPTSRVEETSSFTIQQQRANSLSNSFSPVSTTRHSANDVIVSVGTVASKVVPLPVKDFFTHTPKENTYSALLMAKITNKNKQYSGYQKVSELLRNFESLNTAHRCAFEIDNHLQRNLVIDLTDSDDDCKLLPVNPQEHPINELGTKHLQVTSRDNDSMPVSGKVDSCANEITSPDTENTGNLHSVGLSMCDSDFSEMSSDHTDKSYLEEAVFMNTTSIDLTGLPNTYTIDVENTEPHHNQEEYQPHRHEARCENIPTTENSIHPNVGSTSVILKTYKLAASTHPNAECSYPYMGNENVDRTGSTRNNRACSSPALHLKIDSPGKELMARKLRSAMSMRIHPEEPTLKSLPMPLTCVYEEGARVETQPFPVSSLEERIQTSTSISVHDNSTQRAAATLLELSANPIYNPYMISPEGSGDFQEKVYQIHPVLPDHENNRWDTRQGGQNNSLGFQSNQSYNVPGTKAHKNKSCRRVGRPPKDQYTNSDSVTLVKPINISSNMVTPTAVPNNTSSLTQALSSDTRLVHSVTPYSFSNVTVHPPNVAYDPQTPVVSIGPGSLPYMFHINYEFPDRSKLVRDLHGRAITTMEYESLRGDHVSNSQDRNIREHSRHTTNASPQFKDGIFASVASKMASDIMLPSTAIQTMTVITETHLSNGLQVVHNSNTGTFPSKSPSTNISDLESITRSGCDSKCSTILATNQQTPNPSVEYSMPPASMAYDFHVNTAAFSQAKERTSDPGLSTQEHSRAQKRRHPNHDSQQGNTALCHIKPSQTVPNITLPFTCLANDTSDTSTNMPGEDLTNTEHRNNNNKHSELSKTSKKRRTSKGRVKKRKNKARNKNSEALHLQNSDGHNINTDNRSLQDTQVNMSQAKKGMTPDEHNFQIDEQTIQYGLQDLHMTQDSETDSQQVPHSAGLAAFDRLSWKATVMSDGMSSMERNEQQKEREVTSLLASMMCNKYKGQVQ